jgi:hypothetical protein
MKQPTQLFIIGHAALASLTDEEVDATVAALKEVDLYRLPYERVSVRMQTDDCVLTEGAVRTADLSPRFNFWTDPKTGRMHSQMGPAHLIEFRNVNLRGDPASTWCVHDGSDPGWRPYEFSAPEMFSGNHERIASILITLLATRNAVKETTRNKVARLGIGGKKPGSTKRYEYVTTITVPAATEMEDDAEHAPGIKRAAHLRRGHIRRQHYGPRNQMVRLKFINPVFVNADADWVSTRAAYNVTR